MNKLLIALLLLLPVTAAAENVSLKHNSITLNANLEKADSWPAGPMALITHGTLFHNKSEMMVALQDLLLEKGISTLAINLGLGIDNRGPAPYDCAVPHTHKHADAIDEINSWAQWLKSQGVTGLSVIGHSRGGSQTALFAAEHDSDLIKSVALIAPMTWDSQKEIKGYKTRYKKDLPPLLEKARTMAASGEGGKQIKPLDFIYCEQSSASADSLLSYYEDDMRKDTTAMLNKVGKPVQVYIGTDDKLIEGLAQRLQPLIDKGKVELVVIEGSDHFFRDLYIEDVADMIGDFINP